MDEIVVQLPEPIIARLREQSLKAEVSLAEMISQRLVEDFGLAVCTEEQARRHALEFLRKHTGYMLRTGTPVFDAKTFVWHVPVLPNLEHGKPNPIGEVRLEADTGEILTDSFTILEIADKAVSLFGIEHFDESFQKRLEELLDKNNSGELSQAERRLLESMVQKVQAKDLENIQRLMERLHLPEVNRKEAFAALKRASAALENSAKKDETKDTEISPK